MAMRSVLRRNLTGATRCYSDGKGWVWNDNTRNAGNLKMQEIERQHSEKLKKQKAEEKLKKEEAEKEKEDADKKSEGTHLG